LTFRSSKGRRSSPHATTTTHRRLATHAAKDDDVHPRTPLAIIDAAASPPEAAAPTPKKTCQKKRCRRCPRPQGEAIAVELRRLLHEESSRRGAPREEPLARRCRSSPPGWEGPAPPPHERNQEISCRRHHPDFARRLTPAAVAEGRGEGWLG
jgi:hypothetical protein